MAGAKRGEVNTSFDIEQLLVEAQHRWLRPAEICELLQNYKKFRIAPEPPNKPPSGSLFLFDRKVSRYFRKDGHNWRKKKDGKTVKEAHERLKVGSVDMLHCYYAHGEENEKFQRRSYWMLEEDLMHIVLVHYREVKEKPSFSRTTSLSHAREVEEVKQVTQMCKVSIPNSTMSQSQPPSQTMGADSPVSSHTSEYEDAESGYPKQTLMQRIIIKQLPDTTLSLRCGSMMIDK
ncbi:calmodulin-binding transcription activator 2-like isoform X1 [Zingiber officinale]|uniref:calmodulin-binding transcription activator 2-like isoform X1 n=1 Tax=Zingiber officinale TaxID=94328 RepID=UPI001C4BE819|nr:calmodulin-binding transcription activator 2-like isoform X1 [Zingiber officinale]